VGGSSSEAKPSAARREEPVIETMSPEDWPEVRRIYEAGIATGYATFETQAPGWAAWDEAHLADHRVVARLEEEVLGWAALAPVSHRPVYAGVAAFLERRSLSAGT
jgi:L-amino acid N-acyltransferase YncA